MKLTEEQERTLEEIRVEHGLEFQNQAVEFLFSLYTGKAIVCKEMPEKCQTCPLFGGLYEGKIHCVLKLENKQPNTKKRSLIEAQACSKAPTLITLERKDELMNEILNGQKREKYWKEQTEKLGARFKEETEKLRAPQEQLLRENSTLESRVSDLENALLRRDEKIEALETEKGQLTARVAELSQGSLFEQNQLLKVQIGQEKTRSADYQLEIEKLEALREKELQEHKAVMTKIADALKDMERYTPPEFKQCEDCTAAFAVYDYVRGIKKTVEQLQGYLAVATSP